MTRDERIKELKAIVMAEEDNLKKKMLELFSPAVVNRVGIALYTHSYEKELHGELYIVGEETKEEIFGTDIDFYVDRRSNYKLAINYPSIGNHVSSADNGAYRDKDILIGKLWENEETILDLYRTINWDNVAELVELNNQVWREKKAAEQKIREEEFQKERRKLDEVLTHLYEDKIIKHSKNDWNTIVIKKVGRKNITLYNSIRYNYKWTKVIEKYDFAKYLIDENYLWKTN